MTHTTAQQQSHIMLMQSNLIHDLCKPMFEVTGAVYFAYIEIFENGDFLLLSSDAEYYRELLEHGLIDDLPVQMLTRNPKLGLSLADLEKQSYFSQPEIQIINQKCRYDHFFQFIHKSKCSKGNVLKIYMYGSPADQDAMNHFCINNVEYFNQFNNYLDLRVDKFLQSVPKYHMSAENLAQFDELFTEFLSKNQNVPVLNNRSKTSLTLPGHHVKKKSIVLSPREKEIVMLMSQGLTAQQTSERLHISKRTVERHFENLRKKLKCKNKGQIINRLLEHGVTLPLLTKLDGDLSDLTESEE